jgi:hypothetical protein
MALQLRRKIDEYLAEWKKNPNHLPLIVKGARQIGKTKIRHQTLSQKHRLQRQILHLPVLFDVFAETVHDVEDRGGQMMGE